MGKDGLGAMEEQERLEALGGVEGGSSGRRAGMVCVVVVHPCKPLCVPFVAPTPNRAEHWNRDHTSVPVVQVQFSRARSRRHHDRSSSRSPAPADEGASRRANCAGGRLDNCRRRPLDHGAHRALCLKRGWTGRGRN